MSLDSQNVARGKRGRAKNCTETDNDNDDVMRENNVQNVSSTILRLVIDLPELISKYLHNRVITNEIVIILTITL